MRHLKRFNEELKGSTFRSAADKLKRLGHIRRSQEIESHAIDVEEREEKQRIEQRTKWLKEQGPFQLQYYKSRYNSATKSHDEDLLCEGSFYIEPSFNYIWFSDSVSDYLHDSRQYGLLMFFEFGTTPADVETANKWKEIESKLSEESYHGMYYGTRLGIQVIPEGNAAVVSNGKCFWESRDSDMFLFTNRSEAMRFKKLLIEALEGKITWGKNEWDERGIISGFDRYFINDENYRQRKIDRGEEPEEIVFSKEDMPKIISTIRTGLSVNQLYRN